MAFIIVRSVAWRLNYSGLPHSRYIFWIHKTQFIIIAKNFVFTLRNSGNHIEAVLLLYPDNDDVNVRRGVVHSSNTSLTQLVTNKTVHISTTKPDLS